MLDPLALPDSGGDVILPSDELSGGGIRGGRLGSKGREEFWEELMGEISTMMFFCFGRCC